MKQQLAGSVLMKDFLKEIVDALIDLMEGRVAGVHVWMVTPSSSMGMRLTLTGQIQIQRMMGVVVFVSTETHKTDLNSNVKDFMKYDREVLTKMFVGDGWGEEEEGYLVVMGLLKESYCVLFLGCLFSFNKTFCVGVKWFFSILEVGQGTGTLEELALVEGEDRGNGD